MSEVLTKRYEFVMFVEVENGNPNGDPDAGNMPRIDPETSHGLITDVCIKRKVRNYVALVKAQDQRPYDIYVQEGAILNNKHLLAYQNHGIEPKSKELPKDATDAEKVTHYMCDRFFDVRTFGAVMTTEVNCGQVRGPIQFAFGRSLDPIVPQEVTITRVAVTKAGQDKVREMGRKHSIPYALYRIEGFISAPLAQRTGFSSSDLELFWEALLNMYEHDHSASRGRMATRRLIVFEHQTSLGNAPAHELFELVTATRNDSSRPPRAYTDYTITVDEAALPQGVTVLHKR